MTIKLHYLHSRWDHFPENLRDFSEEQGEKFHQVYAQLKSVFKEGGTSNDERLLLECTKRFTPSHTFKKIFKKNICIIF
jgi:hypothetical protein